MVYCDDAARSAQVELVVVGVCRKRAQISQVSPAPPSAAATCSESVLNSTHIQTDHAWLRSPSIAYHLGRGLRPANVANMSAITVKTTMKSAASDSDSVAKLIPRAYQEEVFTRAQYGNIIAALDTGSGKTFIAALLIKWITSLPEVSGKKVVFLVPKVPLVDQQREFLSCQTPLEVRGYIGAMNVDSWGAARWAVEFKQADVLIMTR